MSPRNAPLDSTMLTWLGVIITIMVILFTMLAALIIIRFTS